MVDEIEFALMKIADESRPVRATNLAPLSDLPRSQMDQFNETWAALSPDRRLELASALVEEAETNLRYNFSTIFRICLRDADPRLRRLAVDGLWEDNRPSLVAPLTDLLLEDPTNDVRAAAASSLGRFILMGELGEISNELTRHVAETLESVWLRPIETLEVRRRALESLAYLGIPKIREFIQNAYYDEDELMRQSAVFAMGRSADRRWAKVILDELFSGVPAMRFEAATAAGELGLQPAVRPLIQLLEDADSSVREAAAMSLGLIGGPEARRALADVAAGDDERLAEAAEEALQELAFNVDEAENLMLDYHGEAAGGREPAARRDDDDEDDYAVSEEADDFFQDDVLADDFDEDDDEWDEDDDELEEDELDDEQ